ncbi:MAG: retropepsin-like aspartic protease [Candidatus Paceibacterota bacterium]|jgi:hypothetical protein
MKFRYAKYNQILRPVIPIKLKNKNQKIGYLVLIDSGADICLFNAEIGEAIGIEIKKGKIKEVFGIGGKASFYYLHRVKIEVGGYEYEIDAGFMPSISGSLGMPYGVVGQNGFFEHFKVIFDKSKEEIELKAK